MQFTVRDWMVDLVVFVDPEIPVTDALETMRRRYISSLIVSKTDAHPDFGILTSTDVSDKIVAQGQNPADLKVFEIMTCPMITVSPELPIGECAKLMSENHFHHLPVADKAGNIVGMISATDFLVVAEAMGRTGERALRG
jgi:signal-transduction protein with cAMP-binding, CBS, and nucleotidyltransferase domain